jgi:hypothetical protein
MCYNISYKNKMVGFVKIFITQWALDSYLNLKHDQLFSEEYYKGALRPDVLRLKNYPDDPKFDIGKFWSPAKLNKSIIQNGYKMKWHQVGNGKVQLRLPVCLSGDAYLCEAYVKRDEKLERRKLAKFKTHIQLIEEGRFSICGELS